MKQRPHQDIRQSLGVLEIHQGTTQKRHVLRFIRLREQRAARNHAIETRLAQRLSVQIRMRCGSQQKHHLRQIVTRRAHARKILRNALSLRAKCIVFRAHFSTFSLMAHGNVHENTRIARTIPRAIINRLQIKKVLAKHGLLSANLLHKCQHIAMAAEVSRKLQRTRLAALRKNPLGKHLLLIRAIQRNVGATEAINTLLRIAHGAQIPLPRTGKLAYNCQLQRIGVLELIDHHQTEFILIQRFDLVVLKRTKGLANQVAVIQHGKTLLFRGKKLVNFTRKLNQLIENKRTLAQQNAQRRFIETRIQLLDKRLLFFASAAPIQTPAQTQNAVYLRRIAFHQVIQRIECLFARQLVLRLRGAFLYLLHQRKRVLVNRQKLPRKLARLFA